MLSWFPARPFEIRLKLGGVPSSMTASTLRNQSCKELSQMARAIGLSGWHSMRKDELVRALVNHARRKPKGSASSAATTVLANGDAHSNGKATHMKENESLRKLRNRLTEIRQISSPNGHESRRQAEDRLV